MWGRPPSRHHDPAAPSTGEVLICGPNATGVCPFVAHQPWPPPACTAITGSEETPPHCSLLCTHRILAFKERSFRDDSKEWHHQTVRAGLTRTHPPPHPQEPARTRENARSRRIHTHGWLNRITVADREHSSGGAQRGLLRPAGSKPPTHMAQGSEKVVPTAQAPRRPTSQTALCSWGTRWSPRLVGRRRRRCAKAAGAATPAHAPGAPEGPRASPPAAG